MAEEELTSPIVEPGEFRLPGKQEGGLKKGNPAVLEPIVGNDPTSKFQKKKMLGQGSFGTAWKVEETGTQNIYAAKIMDTNSMSDKDRGFITNEVKCLARCSNPHIIRHVMTCLREGMLLIIMEFADGGDLYRQIKARQPQKKYFKEHEVLFIFLQLCLALEHIHTQKMMHRDLKTANVLLTTSGLVKLGDFGFSRQYEDSLSNPVGSTFCGTPYYLSPELWRRSPYSKKSEMWALGVVLYETMALRRPFGGKNMDELIDNILHGRRLPLPAHYSPELCNVVQQLLSISPDERPTLRQLFQQPYIRNSGLNVLKRSVEGHVMIPPQVRQEIVRCVEDALANKDVDYEPPQITPKKRQVKRHTPGSGWVECELALTTEALTVTMAGGGEPEVIPITALTSVCSIDPSIANEQYVFAVKNQTGKAFWLKETDSVNFNEWLAVLHHAMPL